MLNDSPALPTSGSIEAEVSNGHGQMPAVDVAIVGGGLAGSLCALLLSRRGYSTCLFDLHEAVPAEFRAEQLVGPQIAQLAALGVLDVMTALSALYPEAYNARRGSMIDRTRVDQYGVPYQHMVSAVRSLLGPSVRFSRGRVAAIETSDDQQRVILADGRAVESRVVVLATGLSSPLAKRLGIGHSTIRTGHSIAIGFDVALPESRHSAHLPLIYYGETFRDRIDYFALFPMHNVLRANLFCYQPRDGDWVKSFAREPDETLRRTLPGLAKILGAFRVTSPVQIRPNDLRVATNVERDGVVLIGDAFQTPCPAAGTGIDRLLSDLDVLCTSHLPVWLSTPGMPATKISTYYGDPRKRAFDAECLRIAEYRRASTTEEGLGWAMHRQQVYVRRRLRAFAARFIGRKSQSAPPVGMSAL